MFSLRQRAIRPAGKVFNRSIRAYSSEPHGKADHTDHGGEHDHHDAHHHAHTVNENLGTSFYLILAAFPISIGIYKLSRPNEDGSAANPISKIIGLYTDRKETWMYRAELHTRLVEQAAEDRLLFQGTRQVKHINLRFPEVFNTGSPYNVPAGQSGGNLEQLVQHYQKLAAEADEAQMKKLRDRQNQY